MSEFTQHEGQDSVIVRGAMAHSILTLTEFEEWLTFENCTRSPWRHSGGTPLETALIYYPDSGVRCMAMRLHADAFEAVY